MNKTPKHFISFTRIPGFITPLLKLCYVQIRLAPLLILKFSLKHELIHSYDHSNERYDLIDCLGVAHSEIRAAREANCHRSYLSYFFNKEDCIKRHANASTDTLYKGRGSECVKEAYDSAMRDLEPFAPNKEMNNLP